jgi:hypothetical protein
LTLLLKLGKICFGEIKKSFQNEEVVMPATLEMDIQLTPEQLVMAIDQLDEEELENLLILLDRDLVQELTQRREQAKLDLEAGTLLTIEDAFGGLN